MQRTAHGHRAPPLIALTGAWKAAPFLFGSGFCALVYQVAWQREFRLVFGASTAASAAVLAIFMGSLGAGGWVLGRRADRSGDPWGMYARLEALVAVTAALTPPLLIAVRWTYLALGGSVVLGGFGGTVLRLLLAALVLLPPLFLAGGTLPAAARAVETEGDRRRGGLALLYGVNTLGAVAGAMTATFALLELFGTRGALWLACLANLVVAVTARALRFSSPPEAAAAPVAAEPATASPRLVYAAAAAVGFAFFLMELVWYRMLGPILGGTVYTFGLILAVALSGIALGGVLYALVGPRRPPTVGAFAVTCWVEAACIAAPFVLGDRIALLALGLRPPAPDALADYLPGWIAVCAIVVLPASIVAGAQFPLLVALLGRGRAEVGHHLGRAYAWNTVGAIAGSLAGGFGLLPLLTAPGTWRAVAIGLAGTGVAAAVAGRAHRLTALACLAGTGAVSAAVLAVPGPTAAWRHGAIGAGRAQLRSVTNANATRSWVNQLRRMTLWEAEGVESSIALQATTAYAFVVNGKVDGNARHDAPTQVMGGLLGAMLHPAPRTAMVVGLGTGSTAGWLAAVPTMERVDVVEIEPAIAEVARACAPVNLGVMDHPRVAVRYADAREVLMTTPERYDVIFSEPSNPYRAGVASFFTRDFYVSVAARLADGGLLLQWVQGYEVDDDTILTILATLASVFPSVEIWQTQSKDLLFVASAERSPIDAAWLAARVREEPFRTALRAVWRADSPEAVLAHFVAGPALARRVLADGARVNTDDRNHVEFGFARTLGRRGEFRLATLRRAAAGLGADRPATRGDVDWRRVEAERLTVYPSFDEHVPKEVPRSAEDQFRVDAYTLYLGGQRAAAAAAFARQGRPPTGPFEIAMIAESLADVGGAPDLEALGSLYPAEAEVIRARLLTRQGRPEEGLAALERAFAAYRTDPWPLPRVMKGGIDLAEEIARDRPDLAPRAFEALDQPFAVRLFDNARQGACLRIVQVMPIQHCRRVLEPMEPHVPWAVDMLLYRRNCYEATGDPRLDRADMDLAEFLRNDREDGRGAPAAEVE